MTRLASKRKLWFTISLIVIVPGLISLIFSGLKLGIDFTGGTLWEVRFSQPATASEIETALHNAGVENVVVQRSGPATDETFLIRMPEVPEGSRAEDGADPRRSNRQSARSPNSNTRPLAVRSRPQIRNRAILAVALASVGILLYMAYAFRNTQNPSSTAARRWSRCCTTCSSSWACSRSSGLLFNVQIDALFITALLTVIGFSVHDTIVVFDRIRENLAKHPDESFEAIVDYSLAQTIVRSLNTSLTVIFTLLALVLFGGGSTRLFVLALLIGIVSGTYSSIFNASQLLVAWENGEIQRLFRRFSRARSDAALPAA